MGERKVKPSAIAAMLVSGGLLYCTSSGISMDAGTESLPPRQVGNVDAGSLALADDWRLLVQLPHAWHEGYSFLARAPDDWRLMTTTSSGYPSSDAGVEEFGLVDGGLFVRDVFRHVGKYTFGPTYLPDGTAFIDHVVNLSVDYSKGFWVDLDGTAYEVFDAYGGGNSGISQSVGLDGGWLRTVIAIGGFGNPCHGRSRVVTSKPGEPPILQCAEPEGPTPVWWLQSEDGRWAGAFYNKVFEELEFDGGGIDARTHHLWQESAFDAFGEFLALFPKTQEDGGHGLIVRVGIRNSVGSSDQKYFYIARDESADAGVAAVLLPDLPLKFVDAVSHGYQPYAPKEVNGWWYFVDQAEDVIRIYDPDSYRAIAAVPLRPLPDPNPYRPLYSVWTDGRRLYLTTQIVDSDAGTTSYWGRIATEVDPYLSGDGGAVGE